MGILEVIVVFVIAWWLLFLPSLSVGSQSQQEAGEVVPGSDPGAPTQLNLKPKLLFASGGATLITIGVWIILHFGLLDGMIPATI